MPKSQGGSLAVLPSVGKAVAVSAFRVGRTGVTARVDDAPSGPQPAGGAGHQEDDTTATADLVQKAADVYTKWIPGDALAVYMALTTAFRGTLGNDEQGNFTPHAWGLLLAGLGFAAGLCLLGAVLANLSKSDVTLTRAEIVGRVILAVAAFGGWSLTVPGSWWEVKGWNQGVLAAISFAISIGFALVAELVVAVLKPKAQ